MRRDGDSSHETHLARRRPSRAIQYEIEVKAAQHRSESDAEPYPFHIDVYRATTYDAARHTSY